MLRKGGMMGSVSLARCSVLHTHAPSHSALCAAGQDWLLAEVQPSRTTRPSSPPHSAVTGIGSIHGAGRGLCAYWMSYEVPAEPVLPTALPSSICIPSLRLSLPREGASMVSEPDSESKILKAAAAGFLD